MATQMKLEKPRTYKTETNLLKAVEKLNLPQSVRFLVVPQDGRFTAIFFDTIQVHAHMFIADKGFTVYS